MNFFGKNTAPSAPREGGVGTVVPTPEQPFDFRTSVRAFFEPFLLWTWRSGVSSIYGDFCAFSPGLFLLIRRRHRAFPAGLAFLPSLIRGTGHPSGVPSLPRHSPDPLRWNLNRHSPAGADPGGRSCRCGLASCRAEWPSCRETAFCVPSIMRARARRGVDRSVPAVLFRSVPALIRRIGTARLACRPAVRACLVCLPSVLPSFRHGVPACCRRSLPASVPDPHRWNPSGAFLFFALYGRTAQPDPGTALAGLAFQVVFSFLSFRRSFFGAFLPIRQGFF